MLLHRPLDIQINSLAKEFWNWKMKIIIKICLFIPKQHLFAIHSLSFIVSMSDISKNTVYFSHVLHSNRMFQVFSPVSTRNSWPKLKEKKFIGWKFLRILIMVDFSVALVSDIGVYLFYTCVWIYHIHLLSCK